MSDRGLTRAVEQLRQLKQNSSIQYSPKSQAFDDWSSAPEASPEKSGSWWNWDWLVKQIRTEGAEQTQLCASQVRNHREREQFRDAAATQAEKYSIETRRIMVDAHVEKRAQSVLQASEVRGCIETSDAIEVCTVYHYSKMQRLSQLIQDKELLAKAMAELRLIHDRAVTDIRITAYGLKYDPARGGREEDI